MNRNYLFLCVLLLILLAACTEDTERNDGGRQILVNAALPGAQTPTDGSPGGPRRIALYQEENSLDLKTKWQDGDNIYLFVKQGNKVYTLEPSNAFNISSDGKTCSFGFKLPSDVNAEKPYTIYGLCDVEGMVEDGVVKAKSQLRRSGWTDWSTDVAPMWFQVAGGASSIYANFKHLGTYEVLHVKNLTNNGVMFQHCGFEINAPWYKYYDSTPLDDNYNPSQYACETGEVKSNNAFIPGSSTRRYLSWYMPSGEHISNARLLANIDGKTVKSSNTKSSNVTIQRGHAYHMYAEWDGTELRFVDGGGGEDPNPVQTETITIPGTNVSFNMVAVEGGTFWMGAADDDSDADSDEHPRHQVTLSSFSIGQTEVTQELWEAVMGNRPSYFKGAKYPVEKVCWNDCQTFISKLNVLTGKNFRLPTEAEWEYAARGGKYSHGYKYSGSNDIDAVAWYYDNSDCETHPVAQKQANELGLYDMSGNVYEWCQDWYSGSYYSNSSSTNPCNTTEASIHVNRGGDNNYPARFCRVTSRFCVYPNSRSEYPGLRLALSDIDTPGNITEGLVAYYPFNGNANDESGNGNHGTVIGNVQLTTDRHSNPNGAYRFYGQPLNYISVPDNESLHLSVFTLNAWVYTDASDYGSGYLINKGRDINNGSYRLGVRSVGATNLYGGSNDAYMPEVPETGVWHMITGTVEGDIISFYLDGVLIDERKLSNPFVYGNSDPLTLGMHYYSGVPSYYAYPLLGVLDEVRIYNRVLSPSEIKTLYNE